MSKPQQRKPSPCPGGHEIYNFGRPFFNHYLILSLLDLCQGVEKKILKEIQHVQFYNFYLKILFGMGVMKFTISCLLILQML